MSEIRNLELDCGLRLVIEPIPNVASVAFSWLLPAGSATDSPATDGYAAILSEFILRGAGGLSSREHSDALDRLGVQRTTDVQTYHLRIDATMLGNQLTDALPLIVDMVRRPMFPPDALPAVRRLSIDELDSLDDDPQDLAMLRLRERHHPPPFNRHGYGERTVLEGATLDGLRRAWSQRFRPRGSILGVAGAVDPEHFCDQLSRRLEGWSGAANEPELQASPQRGYLHVEQSTAQVHIGLAYDAPRERDESSMVERLAVGVLSGSTSGRLFTEVRQKRSLCYSVGASYRAGRDRGMVSLYAGTTPDRAQQTLAVCIEEIQRLRAGVDREEFNRAAVGLKAHLIMQGESTPARAAALVYDQFRLGRARALEEIAAAIDAVSLEQLNAYLTDRDFGELTIVSIGPAPLESSKREQVQLSK